MGGRGGGGGPGLARPAPEDALGRLGEACVRGPSLTANLPASARGGGALNTGRGAGGGEGVLLSGINGEGALGGDGALPGAGLLDGGGAGGGPLLLAVVEPVSSGVNREAGGPGGGGGGAFLPLD